MIKSMNQLLVDLTDNGRELCILRNKDDRQFEVILFDTNSNVVARAIGNGVYTLLIELESKLND